MLGIVGEVVAMVVVEVVAGAGVVSTLLEEGRDFIVAFFVMATAEITVGFSSVDAVAGAGDVTDGGTAEASCTVVVIGVGIIGAGCSG